MFFLLCRESFKCAVCLAVCGKAPLQVNVYGVFAGFFFSLKTHFGFSGVRLILRFVINIDTAE